MARLYAHCHAHAMKMLRPAVLVALTMIVTGAATLTVASPALAVPQDNCSVIAFEPTKTGSTLSFKTSVFCGADQPTYVDQINLAVGVYRQTSPGVYSALKWGNKRCASTYYCTLTVTYTDPAGSQVWLTYGEADIYKLGFGNVRKSDRSATRTF